MIKKCYLLNSDKPTIAAISRLAHRIPCFIDTKTVDDHRFELYITCRAEDITTVERALARYV